MRHRRTVFALSVVAVAAVVFAGALLASNMGFKLNYPLKAAGASSLSGNNTIGLPYNRQVGIDSAKDLFVDMGNFTNVQNIQKFLPATDSFSVYQLGAPDYGLAKGEGYFVKMALDLDYIIVGSHDPSASIALNAAGAGSLSGNNLYAPPYHGTAASAKDLFNELGGFVAVQNIQRFLPATDSFAVYQLGAPDYGLVPGEAYFVKMTVSVNHTPSHY